MPLDSSHWYDREARAVFQVPNKSKPGSFRNTTISDARKLDLVPSTTTILGVIAKPELDRWKQKQVALACLRCPRKLEESEDDWVKRVIEDAFKQVDEAAELGTKAHAATESHFKGQTFPSDMQPFVSSLDNWAKENGVEFLKHELRLVNNTLSYAGTTDARITAVGWLGIGTFDLKTRKTHPDYPCTPWLTEPMQIASYAQIEGAEFGVNVYLSTTQPGRIEACWYDKERLDSEFKAFTHALALWKHINRWKKN